MFYKCVCVCVCVCMCVCVCVCRRNNLQMLAYINYYRSNDKY